MHDHSKNASNGTNATTETGGKTNSNVDPSTTTTDTQPIAEAPNSPDKETNPSNERNMTDVLKELISRSTLASNREQSQIPCLNIHTPNQPDEFQLHYSYICHSKDFVVNADILLAIIQMHCAEAYNLILKKQTGGESSTVQSGYGFVSFPTMEVCLHTLKALKGKTVHHILFDCQLSKRTLARKVAAAHQAAGDMGAAVPVDVMAFVQAGNAGVMAPPSVAVASMGMAVGMMPMYAPYTTPSMPIYTTAPMPSPMYVPYTTGGVPHNTPLLPPTPVMAPHTIHTSPGTVPMMAYPQQMLAPPPPNIVMPPLPPAAPPPAYTNPHTPASAYVPAYSPRDPTTRQPLQYMHSYPQSSPAYQQAPPVVGAYHQANAPSPLPYPTSPPASPQRRDAGRGYGRAGARPPQRYKNTF